MDKTQIIKTTDTNILQEMCCQLLEENNALKLSIFEYKKDILLQENIEYINALIKGYPPEKYIEIMDLFCKDHYFQRYPEDINNDMIKNFFENLPKATGVKEDVKLHLLKCPYCGSEMEDIDEEYNSKWQCKNCKFKLYKNILGVDFNLNDLKELIETGSTAPKIFKSKDRGQFFKARMMLCYNKPKVVFCYINGETDIHKPTVTIENI